MKPGRILLPLACALHFAFCGWAQEASCLDSLSQNTGLPSPIEGNAVELLYDAAQYYDSLLEDIGKAQDYIMMECHIFRQDSISTRFLDAMGRRAEEGVKVYLVIDYLGSTQRIEEHKLIPKQLSRKYLKPYMDKGVCIAMYNKRGLFPREHRKLTIVDGKVAYVGGMNVTDLYLKGIEDVGEFRDKHTRVTGPAVDSLHTGFCRIWSECSEVELTGREGRPLGDASCRPVSEAAGETPLVILETRNRRSKPNADKVYLELFSMARQEMKVISGYTFPDRKVRKAIKGVAARGVTVEILTGSSTDMPGLFDRILQHSMRRLARNENVYLYVHPGGFHHDKVISMDGHILLIGSHNLDYFSFKFNNELSIIIDDAELASQFNEYFDRCAGLQN